MKMKWLLLVLALLGLYPAMAQTYRHPVAAIFAMQSNITPPTPSTYYVLQGGGSRFSSAVPDGQCDGTVNVTYAAALATSGGKTTGLHCAWGDYRYAFDDQSYNAYSTTGFGFKGMDTLIVGPGQWRVGYDAAPGSCSGSGCGAGWTWDLGGQGSQENPTIPAGTPAQHTRILAACYPNCNKSNMTQLYGGYGLGAVLNLKGAQYVDVIGFEITRHSNCIWYGDPVVPSPCQGQNPTADFDSDGIHTDNQTHDVYLQDLWIHGHTARGIKGAIGAGPVTCERCDIAYNGATGWDFDDGYGTPIPAGAVWNFFDSVIEWSGCNQDYPDQTHAISCYGQSSGGQGDGVGTPAGTGMNVVINNSQFNYNTQDGLDLGHIDSGGPYNITITNSRAVGNGGASFKWGGDVAAVDFENNISINNCLRMSASMPGQPAGYNAHLGDFCRSGDGIPFNFIDVTHVTFKHNTIISYAPSTFDMQCWDLNTCADSVLDFEDNIILGYDNPATYNLGGKQGGPIGFIVSQGSLPAPIQANNTWYGIRGYTCLPTETCASPQFVNQPVFTQESDLDNFNTTLSTGSPSLGQGASLTPITTTPPTTTPPVTTPPATTPPATTPPATTPPVAVAEIANAMFIGKEGSTILSVSDPAAVLQFGSGNNWCPTTFSGSATMPVYINYSNPVLCGSFDPAPGTTKVVVAQRKGADYTVTWTDGSITMTTPVPALPVPPPPPPPVSPLPEACSVAFNVDANGAIVFTGISCNKTQ